MSDICIDLCDCTRVICEEVEMGCKQMDIAVSYAMALKSQANGVDKPDWRTINRRVNYFFGLHKTPAPDLGNLPGAIEEDLF